MITVHCDNCGRKLPGMIEKATVTAKNISVKIEIENKKQHLCKNCTMQLLDKGNWDLTIKEEC